MTWYTLAIFFSLMAPGLQFLVSPVFFHVCCLRAPVLSPRREMRKLGAPGALLPVDGTEYRAMGARPLSIPVCAKGAEIG